jgi:hypothetical protein
MSFKLRGKEIFYAVEATIREYAWKKRGNSTTTSSSRTEGRKSNRSVESDRDELTSKFVGLGGTYNSERKRVFEHDQAMAFHIKGFWTSLKVSLPKR